MMATETVGMILDAIRDDVDDQVSWCALRDALQEAGCTDCDSVDTIADKARLARAAYILSAVSREGREHCRYVELHQSYGEAGYNDPECGVIATGNWNEPKAGDKAPEHLGDILDKLGVPCEWSDEWTTCSDCGKLVRTEPDSMDWTPSYVMGEGELLCTDCHEGNLPDDGDDVEPAEEIAPEEDDYTTEDFCTFRQGRRTITVPDDAEWEDVIRADMERQGYFPAVWRLSDHGNAEIVNW